jgi:uncharacterized protein YcbK (DUF882 family)
LIKRLKNAPSRTHCNSRRRFLAFGAGALVTLASGMAPRPVFAQSTSTTPERTLSLYNLHTGESLKTAYWVEGEYIPESLSGINYLLRDFRNGEVKPIHLDLLNLLHDISHCLGTSQPVQLISGYRSPSTNTRLHDLSSGVAKHSLHTDGMAADIRIPGHDLGELHKAAVIMQRGGVGYYQKSDFVHVDVGRVRYWTGS